MRTDKILKKCAIVPPRIKISPKDVTDLRDNYVFVFGSNKAGIHGRGAAKEAHILYGAVWGTGEGMTGRCYAIPTKGYNLEILPLSRISQSIELFVATARVRRDRQFMLTKIGCGLAGYTPEQIAPLFFVGDAAPPENIWWPLDFIPFHPHYGSTLVRFSNEPKPH